MKKPIFWNDGTELYHYGIPGMKWGERNGPPYPLGSGRRTGTERNRTYQDKKYAEEVKNKNLNKNSSFYKQLNISKADQFRIESELQTLGILAGTAAAAVAIGYLSTKKNLITDINRSGIPFLYRLNSPTILHHGGIGETAKDHSFQATTSQHITDIINNENELGQEVLSKYNNISHDLYETRLNRIAEEVRVRQVGLFDVEGTRRLSCWSASNAYYMSVLSGETFASRSFENLVDFNDFGRLYTSRPSIYNISGKKVSDFVGRYGNVGERCTNKDCINLLDSIGLNIPLNGNGRNGAYTVGFINAGYGGMKCTHQFNFDIFKETDNRSILSIVDGYTGARYPVGIYEGNKLTHAYKTGFERFASEMHHYNKESVRFYAPTIDSINSNIMSNIVLSHSYFDR